MRFFHRFEPLIFRVPYGLASRIRVTFFRLFGMKMGARNRFEAGRIRRLTQIKIGALNHFSEGWFLWPQDALFKGHRIVLGDNNYFNRNVMIDACNSIEIGSHNMFGPDIYITDSNHTFGIGVNPHKMPMNKGIVRIGNCCWIGAKAVILKDVHLGDYCVVGAGSVVTRSFPAGSVIAGVPAKQLNSIGANVSSTDDLTPRP
jgi:acetyltransferase-like isoleucine patch superfamily enzyme